LAKAYESSGKGFIAWIKSLFNWGRNRKLLTKAMESRVKALEAYKAELQELKGEDKETVNKKKVLKQTLKNRGTDQEPL